LSPVANTICENGKNIVPRSVYLLAGTATDKLIPDFKNECISYEGPFDSLDEMLSALKSNLSEPENSEKIQVVVFSPGATSFGMFKNEFDRGNQFKAAVKRIFQ
jgi:UDP-N-acetylmuramoylalanine--D-glutamate ligase